MLINNFTNHIHQIWFQEGDLNELWNGIGSGDYFEFQKSYVDFCEKNGWQYTLWREESIVALIRVYFPQYLDEFNKLDSIIKKVDCARLMILYVYGGVYVDLDSYMKKDLNEFLNLKSIQREEYNYTMWHINPDMPVHHMYDLIVGQEKTVCEYHYDKFGIIVPKINNAVIFCRPGLEIFLEVIEKGFKRKDYAIMNSFGVHTFSNTVYQHMHKLVEDCLDKNVYHIPSKILVLPTVYFYEMNVDEPWFVKAGGDPKFINDQRQYIVHKFDGNWDGETYDKFLTDLTQNNITKY